MVNADWDPFLIKKYDVPAPRYTSYPTAVEFNEKYQEDDFIQASKKYQDKPLSVYYHIPFCHKLCYFCGCNKIVTQHKEKADTYLDFLEREIINRSGYFNDRLVTQLHLGGGTPTYLLPRQMDRLMKLTYQYFNVVSDAEIGIEIDPRELNIDYLYFLKDIGFNRISLGIQDFDVKVQKLINREQDEQAIFQLISEARKLNFTSVSVDLIYGLPRQSVDSFITTLNKIIELSPDRISVFNFAYLPQLFRSHKMIPAELIPHADVKLKMFEKTIDILSREDYQFIGMDHFAKKTDELAVLQNTGKLHRNFQGYTTQEECDLLGLGVSAISMLGDNYAQNKKVLTHYYEAIESQGHALWKGFVLSEEDCLRRDIIKRIVCDFKLNFSDFENNYSIDFSSYFMQELEEIKKMEQDGLLLLDNHGFVVTSKGRLLVRHIAMSFDSYSKVKQQRFSKAI